MSAVLTGEHRIGMKTAAKILRCHYETVLKYVVELKAVPSIREGGVPRRRKKRLSGKPVFIDEHGLEKLRQLLPKESVGELAGSGSPPSASTDFAPGLSGSPSRRG